ncbi:MAG: helix-turn-helix transcriptional regulator, partial [Pseudolabrys sp.]
MRAARGLLGWTQVELAEASGVSEISIKNIERGVTDPRSSTLK